MISTWTMSSQKF